MQHTYLKECTPCRTKTDDNILDENDISIATNVVHTSGSYSQALAAILSQYASQLNRLPAVHRRRNLPWRQPLQLPWTLHQGEVSSAGKDCLHRKLFRRGPVRGEYLHDVIQGQLSFYTSQKV